MFGNSFNNRFPQSKREAAIESWGAFLNDITDEQINHALYVELKSWIKDSAPTLPQFRQMCMRISANAGVSQSQPDTSKTYLDQLHEVINLIEKWLYPNLNRKKITNSAEAFAWAKSHEYKHICAKLDELINAAPSSQGFPEKNSIFLQRYPEGLKIICEVKKIVNEELALENN